jgi:phage terminase large subunit-like protein
VSFDCYIRAVIENGKLIFPQDFCLTHDNPADKDKKALDEIQAQLGPYLWAGNYYNNPVADDLVEFRQDWFLKFDYEKIANELKQSKTIMSIDPATRLKQTNDPTAFVITKVSQDGFVRVMHAEAKKLRPNEMIDEAFRLHAIWKPDVVQIETVSAQILWIDLFQQRMKKDKVLMRLEQYDPGTTETKAAKIRKLIPYYARGQVSHAPGLLELESQLLEFPRNAHDDLIDALQAQIPFWTGTTTSSKVPSIRGTEEWWDKLRAGQKKAATGTEKLFEEYRKSGSQRIVVRKPTW